MATGKGIWIIYDNIEKKNVIDKERWDFKEGHKASIDAKILYALFGEFVYESSSMIAFDPDCQQLMKL